jgi:hypothetical protein
MPLFFLVYLFFMDYSYTLLSSRGKEKHSLVFNNGHLICAASSSCNPRRKNVYSKYGVTCKV